MAKVFFPAKFEDFYGTILQIVNIKILVIFLSNILLRLLMYKP